MCHWQFNLRLSLHLHMCYQMARNDQRNHFPSVLIQNRLGYCHIKQTGPSAHHDGTSECEGRLKLFLTSALYTGERSAARQGRVNCPRYQLNVEMDGAQSRPGSFGGKKNMSPLHTVQSLYQLRYPLTELLSNTSAVIYMSTSEH